MNYQVYDHQSIIENYISLRQKPTMIVRNVGPRNIVDETKKAEVYNTYRMLLSLDILNAMMFHDTIFIEFDKLSDALKYSLDNFPKNSSDGDPDYYVYVEVYDDKGRIEYDNK